MIEDVVHPKWWLFLWKDNMPSTGRAKVKKEVRGGGDALTAWPAAAYRCSNVHV